MPCLKALDVKVVAAFLTPCPHLELMSIISVIAQLAVPFRVIVGDVVAIVGHYAGQILLAAFSLGGGSNVEKVCCNRIIAPTALLTSYALHRLCHRLLTWAHLAQVLASMLAHELLCQEFQVFSPVHSLRSAF